MSGLMYATEYFLSARFDVKFCNPNKRSDCAPWNELKKITGGGRVYLFIKNDAPNINLATGENSEILKYTTYQFFLVPGTYLRNEIIM